MVNIYIVKRNSVFASKDKYIYLFHILKIIMKVINLNRNMWSTITLELK